VLNYAYIHHIESQGSFISLLGSFFRLGLSCFSSFSSGRLHGAVLLRLLGRLSFIFNSFYSSGKFRMLAVFAAGSLLLQSSASRFASSIFCSASALLQHPPALLCYSFSALFVFPLSSVLAPPSFEFGRAFLGFFS